ncbi:MAG: retropepsin-like aspartic protease [Saprospiraceae bacterium]
MRFLPIILIAISFCATAQNKIAFLGTGNHSSLKLFDYLPSSSADNFTTSDGMIYVEAEVNGEKGMYLFDTGAPSLVLNASPAEISSNNATKACAVSSNLSISYINIEQFNWGDFRKGSFEGLLVDLHHFDGPFNKGIDGLIGYEIFKEKVVLVDYPGQKIDLLTGRTFKKLIKEHQPTYTFDFNLDQHLPVIEVEIDGKAYKLALDTGAEKNLLDLSLEKEVTFKNLNTDFLQGLDQNIQKVKSGEVSFIKAGNYKVLEPSFLLTDLSHLKNPEFGYDLDGLLGLPFLAGRQFAIDYRKHKIYIW